MVKENNMKIKGDFLVMGQKIIHAWLRKIEWKLLMIFCYGKKIGFESLEDFTIRVLGKLSKDYCLFFRF
jgi:hypothetical protein